MTPYTKTIWQAPCVAGSTVYSGSPPAGKVWILRSLMVWQRYATNANCSVHGTTGLVLVSFFPAQLKTSEQYDIRYVIGQGQRIDFSTGGELGHVTATAFEFTLG